MTRMGGYSSGGIICMNERGGIQTVSRGERGSLVLDVGVAERSEGSVVVDEDTGGVLEVGVVGDGLETVEEGDHLVQEGLLLLEQSHWHRTAEVVRIYPTRKHTAAARTSVTKTGLPYLVPMLVM